MRKLIGYTLWLGLAAAHTWLFYDQDHGQNALVFSVLTVALVTWYHNLWSERNWQAAVVIHMAAAVSLAWHGAGPAVALYRLTLFGMAGLVFAVRTSLPMAMVNGVFGTVLLGFFWRVPMLIKDFFSLLSGELIFGKMLKTRAAIYIAPIVVTIVFYLLYGLANPDFMISLQFPEFEINWFTFWVSLLSIVIICPLIFSWGIKSLTDLDLAQSDQLKRRRAAQPGARILGLKEENSQGTLMFTLLNILIAAFLVFSVAQMFFPSLVKSGSSHSERVHEGFWVLILSMIAAISLILLYFRKNLNFFSGKGTLVKRANVWIGLNAGLALLTAWRNAMYVLDFGLTYKRIWVFIAVLLVWAGLLLAFRKVRLLKTNWSFIKDGSWVLAFVLAVCVMIDWDKTIVSYNTHYARNLDVDYLLSLGEGATAYVCEMSAKPQTPQRQQQVAGFLNGVRWRMTQRNSWRSQTWDDRELTRLLAEQH